MKDIAKNFKGHWGKVIAGPLFKLLEAVLELFVPLVMADMIDVGVRNRDVPYLLRGGIILLALAVGGVVAAMICQYFAAIAAGHFGRSLCQQVYAHAMRLSANETAAYGPGGLVTRVSNDTNQIQNGVNMLIRLGTRVPFLIIGGIVMAMTLNWRLGLVFLAAIPVIALVLFLVMRRTLPGYAKIQAGQDDLARLSGENLAGARVIRAFSRQRTEQAEFARAADELNDRIVRVGKLSALLNPLTSAIVSAAIVGVVWLGGRLAFAGDGTPGEIIAMVSYMNQILLAMVIAANLVVLFTRAIASTRRVAALLQTEPSITDGPGAQPAPDAPVVAFQNVSFRYHTGAGYALEDVSFSIARGQTVGIIGGTGSGKSTLLNLMLRYYDVQQGTVQRGGADVRDYALQPLRAGFGLVPQHTTLFSGSVRHNLRVGAPAAGDEQLWLALRAAQADGFVRQMDGGLDAEIREGGKNLSGGQRQRLCIARALVRRPDILLLDDATSALDYATDAALRNALRTESEARGMTSVMISQRAASIQNADWILVMDDGRLAGAGTHRQLLRENEIYREICASQGIDGAG